MSPDGVSRQWTEFPPEALPAVFGTHRPVCADCNLAAEFKRLYPDRVTIRSPRPA